MLDIIIIGGGPAGLTAGIYAGRSRLKTVILEKGLIGGRILMTEVIENFPGFPKGISTQELIKNIEEQVRELGVEIITEEAKDLDINSFEVKTEKNKYKAKAIIIATGAQSRRLNVPGEEKFQGKGLSYCAICDGPLYKDKKVVIVGGGNAAAEEALYLARFASSVDLIHRRDQLRASSILQERLRENKKINFILNSVVTEINGTHKVNSIKIKDKNTQKEKNIDCHGIFIYVGIEPNTSFVKHKLNMDDLGFIITDEDMATSQKGIFACGECLRKNLYQMITACSEGAIAAESANRYLMGLK